MTDDDRRVVLAKVGVPSVDALYNDVPVKARLKAPADLPRRSWAGLVSRFHSGQESSSWRC